MLTDMSKSVRLVISWKLKIKTRLCTCHYWCLKLHEKMWAWILLLATSPKKAKILLWLLFIDFSRWLILCHPTRHLMPCKLLIFIFAKLCVSMGFLRPLLLTMMLNSWVTFSKPFGVSWEHNFSLVLPHIVRLMVKPYSRQLVVKFCG